MGIPDKAMLESLPSNRAGLVQIVIEETGSPTEVAMQPQMQDLLSGGGLTVMGINTPSLPYCNNSVNTLVLTRPTKLARSELRRVLAPHGMLVDSKGRSYEKPWPADMDEWTHNLYDAGNNMVADDKLVGPPDQLRWIGSPDHIRHHNFLASVSAVVSAKGRLFAVLDQGSLLSPFLPSDWVLSARDAFNGLTLWEKKIPDWGPKYRNFRSGPAEIARRTGVPR